MSDVVRNYTWGGSFRKRRRNLRHRGKGVARFLLPVLFLLIVCFFWLTRDNYSRENFIPADAGVEIYIHNIVEKRADILRSHVFNLVPESSKIRHLLDTLSGDLSVPEWLLNNLSEDLFHVYGTDIEHIDEMVISMHMTRIGGVTERLMRFSSSIQEDFAGGLYLRYVPDIGAYYAVRGRTLLFSLSREHLVRALTLCSEEVLPTAQFQEGMRKAVGIDAFCLVKPAAWPVTTKPFDCLEISLRIEADTAQLSVRSNLSPAFMTRYAPFLSDLTPRQLVAPFDSMTAVSMDLGIPLCEVIGELNTSVPLLGNAADFLETSRNEAAMSVPIADIQTLFSEALCVVGTRTRIGWFGVESYEMLPVPRLAATFDADTDTVLALFERIIPVETVNSEVDFTLRLDDEHLMSFSPVIGGASFEPAVTSYAGGLLFSSSRILARELIKSEQLSQTYSKEGNIYILVEPLPVLSACLDAARELAFSGLLRGYTPISLEKTAQPFLDAAATIEKVAFFASCDKGALQMDLKLSMNTIAMAVSTPMPENPKMNN